MLKHFHETAIIDSGATIGKNTYIWHWSHICKGATIGDNCSVGQNVFIANEVSIGNNVKIQNNVSVYDKVTLEDNVFCGPSMVFTNTFNPRCEFPRKQEYKKTLIKNGATLGANCTIICGVTIGKYAFIAAGSVITKSIPDFALMMGVPAKQTGWVSRYGQKLDLPITGNAVATCPHTREKYSLTNSVCVLTVP